MRKRKEIIGKAIILIRMFYRQIQIMILKRMNYSLMEIVIRKKEKKLNKKII